MAECQNIRRDESRMMSGAQSPSPSSSPQPSRENGELQNDSDSVGTRNEEENNIEEDPDQYEERFRVDRRKLEQMLHGELCLVCHSLALKSASFLHCEMLKVSAVSY